MKLHDAFNIIALVLFLSACIRMHANKPMKLTHSLLIGGWGLLIASWILEYFS